MNIENFLENVIEQIKEIQLKLGFAREIIRLYYPVESLCRLLDVEYDSGKELLDALKKEEGFAETRLGSIVFARSGERILIMCCILRMGSRMRGSTA